MPLQQHNTRTVHFKSVASTTPTGAVGNSAVKLYTPLNNTWINSKSGLLPAVGDNSYKSTLPGPFTRNCTPFQSLLPYRAVSFADTPAEVTFLVGARVAGSLVGIEVGTVVGTAVGTDVGVTVGTAVGVRVGTALGEAVGIDVGVAVGILVGIAVGVRVGIAVGTALGVAVGVRVGIAVGVVVGIALGLAVGLTERTH